MGKPSVMLVRGPIRGSEINNNLHFIVVYNVLLVLLLCLMYGPLFACVNTPRPLLGHVTGLFYLLLLSVNINVLFYNQLLYCIAPG